MKFLCFILSFLLCSTLGAQEKDCCPQSNQIMDFLNGNINLEAMANMDLCQFNLAQDPKFKSQSTIKIVVQMGFVDSSNDPKDPKSYDGPIVDTIMQFMKEGNCNFVQSKPGVLTKKMKNGKNIEITFRKSSDNGLFSEKMSADNENFLKNELQGYDILTTIGHSRNGKGFDAYPKNRFAAKKVVPIYGQEFIEKLPPSIKGVGVLACDSKAYLFSKGAVVSAKKKGIAIRGLDKKLFDFRDSVSDFLDVMATF